MTKPTTEDAYTLLLAARTLATHYNDACDKINNSFNLPATACRACGHKPNASGSPPVICVCQHVWELLTRQLDGMTPVNITEQASRRLLGDEGDEAETCPPITKITLYGVRFEPIPQPMKTMLADQ